MDVEIDEDRLRSRFEAYSAIGGTDAGGLHRPALGDADRTARDRFVADLEALGVETWVDELGNVFGRRPGTEPELPPVLVGSHLDSQPNGGRYDGQLGVLAALETLETFERDGLETRRPVEVVNWTNEEGARFDLACTGSGTFAGVHSTDEALGRADRDGTTIGEALERIGYDGDVPCEPRDLHAYLELHIEQGPRLETAGASVGIVSGVVGMAWLEGTIAGEADHAGTTPMYARRDALATATAALEAIRSIPSRLSSETVITTGRLTVEPGSINVIPSGVDLTFDVRSADDDAVETAIRRIESELRTAAEREGTSVEVETRFEKPATAFSAEVRTALAAAAEDLDVPAETLVSGAGHDAMYVNEIAPAGMVFVPSVDGVSHTEAEFTDWADVVAGTNVLATATSRLAAE